MITWWFRGTILGHHGPLVSKYRSKETVKVTTIRSNILVLMEKSCHKKIFMRNMQVQNCMAYGLKSKYNQYMYYSKKLGSMHGVQSVITGLSKEVKQKLFIRGCQHRSVWTGSSNILEMRNIGRPLAALSGPQHYKEQKFQNFQ